MIIDLPDNGAGPSGTHSKSCTCLHTNPNFAKSAAPFAPILDTLPTATRKIGSGCPARDYVSNKHLVIK